MSSEKLALATSQLKGNLSGGWNALTGSSGEYQDLGIARRFGGSAAAYSLRDIGAMNGRVVKVRREQDTTPVDFSAGAIASGGIEQFAIGQSVLDKYNNAAYFPADSAYFSVTETTYSGAFTITFSFIVTGDLDNNNETTLVWGQSGKANISLDTSGEIRFRRNDGGTARNSDIVLDSNIKKNFLHTLTLTRDSSNIVTLVLDGVTQSNTATSVGDFSVARMGFRNRGSVFDVNINNGEHIYAGNGAEASNWLDTGSGTTANATKVGSPVAFTGQGISAFVDTWYDQSGNGRDVNQSTTSLQPKIISDGSIVILNSKPAVSFAGDGVRLSVARFLTSQGNTYFATFDVTNSLYPSQSGVVIRQGANYRISQAILTGGNVGKIQSQVRDAGTDSASSNTSSSFDGQTILQTTIISATRGADGIKTFVNSANEATADTTDVQDVDFSTVSDAGNNALFIGSIDTGAFDFLGNLGEVVLFNTDRTSDKTDIENDIKNYYGI